MVTMQHTCQPTVLNYGLTFIDMSEPFFFFNELTEQEKPATSYLSLNAFDIRTAVNIRNVMFLIVFLLLFFILNR